MLGTEFEFDAFLSYSSKDKSVVAAIADRLQRDGVKVWLDAWQIKPGDHIPTRIEYGLEHSRILLFCMSENAFGADWPHLEAHTFRFRDPLNKERRFIPLRLDGAPVKGSLAQFAYIDWVTNDNQHAYAQLLEASRPPALPPSSLNILESSTSIGSTQGHPPHTPTLVHVSGDAAWQCINVLEGHQGSVFALTFSPNRTMIVSGSEDGSIRIWDIATGACLQTIDTDSGPVREVVVSADGLIYSASQEGSISIWNPASGALMGVLRGHTEAVYGLAVTRNGARLVSGSADATMRVWNTKDLSCQQVIEYHRAWVNCICFLPDQDHVVIGTEDGFISKWDLNRAAHSSVVGRHSLWVWGLALSANGSVLVSGSGDSKVCVWDIDRRALTSVFEGHEDKVSKVALTDDARWAISGSLDRTARVWDLATGGPIGCLTGHSRSVECVAVHGNGRRIATGSKDRDIRLWQLMLDHHGYFG